MVYSSGYYFPERNKLTLIAARLNRVPLTFVVVYMLRMDHSLPLVVSLLALEHETTCNENWKSAKTRPN
jgi:hypothetical protein